MKIYLAGKISQNGWRHTIVKDLRGTPLYDEPFPKVMPAAIFGEHDYVGPFFVSCDHGCFHGPCTHGVNPKGYVCCPDRSNISRGATHKRAISGIRNADLIFAWVDNEECYGTLCEIGFAYALKKKIAICMPYPLPELWFADQMATVYLTYKNPADGLRAALKT